MSRWYSRKHYRLLSNGGPDRPGDAERRVKAQAARDAAFAETVAEVGELTAENAQRFADALQARLDALSRAGIAEELELRKKYGTPGRRTS